MDGIGKIIQKIREQAGITQVDLSMGLCSSSTLSRFEWEERMISKWVIDGVLQRLGKSTDKFWTIVHIKDYSIMEFRRKIWNAILKEEYQEARKQIKKYKNTADNRDQLQKQYMLMAQGFMEGKEKQNWKESIEMLTKSIKMTVTRFLMDKLEDMIIGRDEINAILLLAEAYARNGELELSKKLISGLLTNVQKRNWDEEELVKIYPKIIRFYVEFLKMDDKYEDVIVYSNKAVKMLTDNGVIYLLAELMECVMWGMERRIQLDGRNFSIREEQEYIQLKRHVEVLKDIWEEYGNLPAEKMIYCINMQRDVSISSEILRKCRTLCKWSQETLSADICSAQDLSRIEGGKISPMERNYKNMMERMNQATERTRRFINAEEYEVQEGIRQVEKYISGMEYQKAAVAWNKLKDKIPEDSLENKQYIMRYDSIIKYTDKKESWKEATVEYENALRITMPDFENIDITKWPLSRNEIFLLCNIASGYQMMGKINKANAIYNGLITALEESKVEVCYRITEYVLIAYNLGIMEGLNGNIEKACGLLKKGIGMSLKAGRFNYVARLLYGLGWIEKNSKEIFGNKKAHQILQQAFYISNILNQCNLNQNIQDYYQKEWDDSLEY
ncbi:MAG: helix-turn-helix transcriptional regulator [Lachnospiraceae bacterium]